MSSKPVKRDQDIDREAIARWNNEGGAPVPLRRGLKKAEAEARVEVFRGQPSLAVPSAMPVTEINANTLSGRIRPL